MKAVAKTRPEPGIDVLELQRPPLAADDVLVRVDAAGICGSDVHIYEWTPGYEFLTKHFPAVLGHEFAGVVEAVGDAVRTGVRAGDRVTSETARTCGRCVLCRAGQGILCPMRAAQGRVGLERRGAMSALVAVPGDCVHRVPDGVSLEEAALTEPAAVALGAVRTANLEPGEPLVILGPGPIGLLTLQLARAVGAGPILVVGHASDGKRLATAEALGAAETSTGDATVIARRVDALTGGVGLAVVIEASGAPAAAALGLSLLRKGGTLVLVGIYPEPLRVDATRDIVRQMKSIRGSYGGSSADFDRVLALMASRQLDVRPLISEVLPLAEATRGFELLRRKEAFKVLLRPESDERSRT
jgi:2-desacetyl-2-hydroxyethyl bacteriochlorophyllide A dehydrogenase